MRVRKRGAGQEDPARAAIIERELSIGPMAASILCSRGIDTPEAARTFLYYEDLCDPFGFHGMEEAVALAHQYAHEGDVVSLSPACASFDLYPNFEVRGDHFKQLVHAL